MIEGLTFQNAGSNVGNNGSLHKSGPLGVKEDIKDLTAEQKEILIYATSDNPLPIIFQDISKDIKIKDFFKEPIASLNKNLKDLFKGVSADLSKTIKESIPENIEEEGYSPFENDIIKQTLITSTKIDDIFKVLQDLSSKEIKPEVKEEVVDKIENTFKEVEVREVNNETEKIVNNEIVKENTIKEINNNETEKIVNNNNELFKEVNNNTETVKEINNNNNEILKEINNNENKIENNIIQKDSVEKEVISKETINNIPTEIPVKDTVEATEINNENLQLDKNITIEKILSTIPESLKEENKLSLENSKTFKNILEILKKSSTVNIKKEDKEKIKKEEPVSSQPLENSSNTILGQIKSKILSISDGIVDNITYSEKIKDMSLAEAYKLIKTNSIPTKEDLKNGKIEHEQPELIKETKITKEIEKEVLTTNNEKTITETLESTDSLKYLEDIAGTGQQRADILSSILKSINVVTEPEETKTSLSITEVSENLDLNQEDKKTKEKPAEVHLTDYLKEESKKEEASAEKIYERIDGNNSESSIATLNSMDNISNILKNNGELLSTIISVIIEATKEKETEKKVKNNPKKESSEDEDSGGVPSILDMATGMFKMIK